MVDTIRSQMPPKQRQIVQTAEKLFLRHGIRRVTVEEICCKAGVSKMTFYKYFANKLTLASALWDLWIEESLTECDAILQREIPFAEKLRCLLEYKFHRAEKMSDEAIQEFLKLGLDQGRVKQWFLAFVQEAQRRGDIHPEVHPQLLLAIRDKFYELGQDHNLRRLYPSYVEFIQELWNVFFYGILTRPSSDRKDKPQRASCHG